MWGRRLSPEIPTYGTKVIALQAGTLDLHGCPRTPVWTYAAHTIDAGQNFFLVNDTVFDWKQGERVVLSPTSFDQDQAEDVRIRSVVTQGSYKKVTFGPNAKFQHYSKTNYYCSNTKAMAMRAEVAVFDRNILIQGDPVFSRKDEFGATMMYHSHKMGSYVARISFISMTQVGQADRLSRYPLHFHMSSIVSDSYLRGNAVWYSYNRFIVVHASHYVTVEWNVGFKARGHAIFVEDAVEVGNVINWNLHIHTLPSFGMTDEDVHPAAIWVSHPLNTINFNNVGGSTHYCFWYSLKDNPIGSSATSSICTVDEALTEFRGNTGHSCGRYGLRLFPGHTPVHKPCEPHIDVAAKKAGLNEWASNPQIPTVYKDMIAYKLQRRCLNVETAGYI